MIQLLLILWNDTLILYHDLQGPDTVVWPLPPSLPLSSFCILLPSVYYVLATLLQTIFGPLN